MPVFEPTEYLTPTTTEEAAEALAKYGQSARIIGGGTQIYELAERGLLSETVALVDLSRLKLTRLNRNGGFLVIGASVTLSELEQSEEVTAPCFGAIVDSLRSIHPVQVKNLATVGGAVCSSISFFDLPVGLATLGAKVEVYGRGGFRTPPVADFMVDFLTPDLNTGELVTSVTVEEKDGSTSGFAKFSLTGNDWAVVNCGCLLEVEGASISSARIVFGGVSSSLLSASDTAGKLSGLPAEPGGQFEPAIEHLDAELKEPLSDYRASAGYRKKLAKVLLREALNKALTRERG